MIIILLALLASYIFPLAMYFFLRANRREDPAYKKDCRALLLNGLLLGFPVFGFSLLCHFIFKLTGIYRIHPLVEPFLNAFILKAFSEELMKYLVGRRIINKNRATLSFLDTMAFACIPAIGFELMEAVIYLIESNVPQILVRGITNMHAIFGLTCGFILAKGYKKGSKNPVILAILIPTLIHGTYDLCLSDIAADTGWSYLALLLAVATLILSIVTYFFVAKARKKPYYTDPLFPEPTSEA